MSQSFRKPTGGRINRHKKIQFFFNGAAFEGYEGDNLAAALLANGIKLVGRSFKYHRPRGIMTAGSEEPNALVQLGSGAHTEPNCRATQVEIFDGLSAFSQNVFPSVNYDLTGINQLIARFLPAGFYYKTFMYPKKLWRFYEYVIRHAAGMGKAPDQPDPDIYHQQHAHCDVLVVGAGPAGLSAALNAAQTGARVILVDEHNEFGGSLLGEDAIIDDQPALNWVAMVATTLANMPLVTCLTRTTLTGYFDHNFFTALERVTDHRAPKETNAHYPRQRFWKIRAKQVILAQGAFERPLVFANNDRPGVMLAGAVRTYIHRYGVLPGREIVVFTNHDNAYHTALAAKEAGAHVEIVDIRDNPDGPLFALAKTANIPIHTNSVISRTHGHKKLHGVDIKTLARDGVTVTGPSLRISADCVAMSAGWIPNVSLFSQGRGTLKFDDDRGFFVPDQCPWPADVVGAAQGTYTLSACLSDGAKAGVNAAIAAGFKVNDTPLIATAPNDQETQNQRNLNIIPTDQPLGRKQKHFVDFQNDVTVSDLLLAKREGFISVEHLKRYTTTGMGTDQGKTSNLNALTILAHALGQPIDKVGTTTFRPPYTPLTFGAIAGQNVGALFEQTRTTPLHQAAMEAGAIFEDVGDWKRARYFPKPTENMAQAVYRETAQVRKTVGLMDASTFGKIEIHGPDAGWFANMIYTNSLSKLLVGQCQYGLMLDENGMVFDDGVLSRLARNHYYLTTTTGGAARVLNWLEMWQQTEWTDKKVYLTSVTEQWAVCVISGPRARDVLQALVTNIDISAAAFPPMTVKTFPVAGVKARVFRVSFTGELAYEINVPARYGRHLYDQIAEAGVKYNLVKYGTETMHVLRAEKGFIIVGQETDGSVTPYDLGLDRLVSMQKTDFIGRRSLFRSDTRRESRRQLVGIETMDPSVVLPEGAHLVEKVNAKPPMDAVGYVTSSYMSPNLGRSIALGLVNAGRQHIGKTFYAPMLDGKLHKVKLVSPVFYKKKGARPNG